MKRATMGLLVAWSLAAAAHASDINVFLSAQSTVSDPPNGQSQTFHLDQTTGLLTPTYYSVYAANGGGFAGGTGYSSDYTTVSMGTMHSYSYSTFSQDGTTSYSEGYVDIFMDDLGVASGPGATVPLTASFSLMGSTSAIPSGAPYGVEAVLYYNLIDVDNGNSATNTAKTFYDLQNPGADVFSATLNAKVGDRIEESVEFEISTYSAGNASSSNPVFPSAAFVDYSNTLHLYVDSGIPGYDFKDNLGYDYATPAGSSATPEPGTSGLMGIGGLLLVATCARRHRG